MEMALGGKQPVSHKLKMQKPVKAVTDDDASLDRNAQVEAVKQRSSTDVSGFSSCKF
jgi:hypothetical protein